MDEYLEKLDKLYKISDLRYKINNIYLSRIKTIRIYNYLKTRSIHVKQITKLVEGGN